MYFFYTMRIVSGENQSLIYQLIRKKRGSSLIEMDLLPEEKNDLLTTDPDTTTCIAKESIDRALAKTCSLHTPFELTHPFDAINTGYPREGSQTPLLLNRHWWLYRVSHSIGFHTFASAMATPPQSMAQALTKKQPEGIALYARFALAGALGCSITHGGFTPVDV
jgi:hypothetical protein